jgi:hypothetical protein
MKEAPEGAWPQDGTSILSGLPIIDVLTLQKPIVSGLRLAVYF